MLTRRGARLALACHSIDFHGIQAFLLRMFHNHTIVIKLSTSTSFPETAVSEPVKPFVGGSGFKRGKKHSTQVPVLAIARP